MGATDIDKRMQIHSELKAAKTLAKLQSNPISASKLTPHYIAGNCDAEGCVQFFGIRQGLKLISAYLLLKEAIDRFWKRRTTQPIVKDL